MFTTEQDRINLDKKSQHKNISYQHLLLITKVPPPQSAFLQLQKSKN